MTAKDFEEECQRNVLGWLWDETFNQTYTETISLSIQEMRNICNDLRRKDGYEMMVPMQYTEQNEQKYKLK